MSYVTKVPRASTILYTRPTRSNINGRKHRDLENVMAGEAVTGMDDAAPRKDRNKAENVS